MMRTIANEYTPDTVSPPRETILELLEERNISQVELAKRMGKTPKAVGEILSDTEDISITPATALQLEQALGLSARFWMNRESSYRESLARLKERKEHEKLIDWLDCLPMADLRKLGYVKSRRKGPEAVREALSFFRVATVDSWKLFWSKTEVSYRMSSAFDSEIGHLAAWLRHGEILAETIACSEYNPKAFGSALEKILPLTTRPIDEICSGLVEHCRHAGVAVVFVPEFPKTHVCGAARWIANGRLPVIYLSLRYKTDDHLWFTFFHEAGHILKHGKKPIYVDDKNPHGARIEEEANRFARNYLIPSREYEEFIRAHDHFDGNTIRAFADKIGISPGIVVGRLQHDGLLNQKFHNGFKRRFTFDGLKVVEIEKATLESIM
ncbi:MAG: helix-turn-helix domain-containing protein [Candidatus Sumerlaeia bacterium]|nr:helix-turn-helix domain-containing protein [Candidatus Sumerlaeia bacterium]